MGKNQPGPGGAASQMPQAWESEHATIAREAAEEGIVLLKNEGVLPLEPGSRVALFGAGASHTVKGGTGSGDVNERHSTTIEEGMRKLGFVIASDSWLRGYDRLYEAERLRWRDRIYEKMNGENIPFFRAYSSTPFRLPAGEPIPETDTDTAVYVISRIAGEGADRHLPGDYLLSAEEEAALEAVCRAYEKVIVIINAGGVMDLSFLDRYPAIRGLLIVSQPGMAGGEAVAAVLSGQVCPSGHLTDSWAFHYTDYPSSAGFLSEDGTSQVRYTEGIYVGYRYFDTFGIPVRYGFGEGLSYTDFELGVPEITVSPEGRVLVRTGVKNTGAVAGRAVVQLYVQLPFGKLEKEARRLAAFAKSGLLQPGIGERLELSFEADALTSYDPAVPGWVLEKGLYGLYLGMSLKESRLVGALSLSEDLTIQRTMHICPVQESLEELHPQRETAKARYLQMTEAAGSIPVLPYPHLCMTETDYTEPTPDREAERITEQLTQEQRIALVIGDPGKRQGSALGSAGSSVPGSAGETSDCAVALGVPGIVLADGPAGLRLTQRYFVRDGKIQPVPLEMNMENGFLYRGEMPEGEPRYQFCTALPVGTMLAQTWNPELVRRCGEAIGAEMVHFGVTLWLAPGMNIHRDPLCGRNFEYYAEDPLLSGIMAAAMTRGVQKFPSCGTTIKHFACNNREDDRMHSDSVLSERALREIYLRGFGIAIRESHPLSIMTSYNLVNGVHAANSHDLCMKAARCEFGFDGVIMTDWTTTNQDSSCTAAGCMRAGNDLVMPGQAMDMDNLREELEAGTLSMEALKRACARLIRVILHCQRG